MSTIKNNLNEKGLEFLKGGGEMGDLIRSYNWESHPLGTPENWPHSLKTIVQLVLGSAFPMFIWWSRELYMFHNDAYLPSLGEKHPEALGAKATDMWAEIWWQIGDIVDGVFNESKKFYAEDLLIILKRQGFMEETYWTFSYSPTPDDEGNVGGLFCACTEVSKKVLGERRLKTIQNISSATLESKTVNEACQKISKVLDSNNKDISFNLIYLINTEGNQAELMSGTSNLPEQGKPKTIDLTKPVTGMNWPLTEVFNFKEPLFINNFSETFWEQKAGPWPEPSDKVIILPIFKSGHDNLRGFFIAGISPKLEFNSDYRGFFELLSSQIDAEIANVNALEEESNRAEALSEIAKKRLNAEITLRNTFLQAPVAITILKGPSYIIDLANSLALELWGRKQEEVLNKPALDAMPELVSQGFEKILEDVYQTGKRFVAIEAPLELIRNGKPELLYINFFYDAFRNPDGDVEGLIGLGIDVTEQVKARQKLEESEERFRSLSDQSPMIVFIIEPNAEATISYWSKTWLNYTGQTFEQALGRAWDGIVHPDDVQPVLDIYVPAFQSRQPYTIPAIRLKRYDGEYRWHLFKASPRHLPNGYFMGYVGVGIDIHDQQMAFDQLETKNAELLKINNDLDNFIYTASHDLKAPMSNIEGLLIALQDKLKSEKDKTDEDTDVLLQLMGRSINRFKTTILDLTEITKAQKSQEEDVSEVNLAELVEDVKLSIYDKVVESGATIETDFSKVNLIKFSRKNLNSIVYNLLGNAVKYRDKNRASTILIQTEKAENYTILTIKDNGLGINKQNQEKMFSMFKRFHDHVEGTGVGLYIVKRIVDNAGGKIEVESEVGKGTTFKVYFKD